MRFVPEADVGRARQCLEQAAPSLFLTACGHRVLLCEGSSGGLGTSMFPDELAAGAVCPSPPHHWIALLGTWHG